MLRIHNTLSGGFAAKVFFFVREAD